MGLNVFYLGLLNPGRLEEFQVLIINGKIKRSPLSLNIYSLVSQTIVVGHRLSTYYISLCFKFNHFKSIFSVHTTKLGLIQRYEFSNFELELTNVKTLRINDSLTLYILVFS